MCLDHRKASLPPPLLSRRAAPSKVARWQNLISSFPWIALGWRAQSKERKGSNFAAQHGGAIVQKPEGPNTYDPKIWLQPSGNHGVEGGRPSLFPLQFLSKVRGERTTTAAAARWSAAAGSQEEQCARACLPTGFKPMQRKTGKNGSKTPGSLISNLKKTSSNLCGATKAVCGFERWGRRRAGGGGGGMVARWR